MTSPEGRKGRALLVITALACFGLGLLAAGIFSSREEGGGAPAGSGAASMSASPSPVDALDASLPDAGGPRIFFDPSSITLLDASLQIDIPEDWDGGAAP